MKTRFLNAAFFGTAILITGCSKHETATVTTQTETGSEKKVEVEYSYAKKDDLVAKMKSQLADVNAEIKKLGDKIATSTGKAKDEAGPKLEELKEKAKNLDFHIDKTSNATESTWNDVKEGSKKALDDAKEGFDKARAWLSEKIAP